MNNYNNNPLPPTQSCPSFGLWLALSIACTLLANKLCGIIAIVYIVFANTAYMQGNYEKYESNFKTVKIALLIGVKMCIRDSSAASSARSVSLTGLILSYSSIIL